MAANDRMALAGLGIGSRGSHDLSCFAAEPAVQFMAIADIRRERREALDKQYGPGLAKFRDFREMLLREDVDLVLIATGDRWHTMASISAVKAGKDVYCEKPCSTSIAESVALAEAADRYGRIYQAGTQRRSIGNFLLAADLCHSGKLGKLTAVHANTLPPATSHDWLPAEPEPDKDVCDWDLWLGPTPWRPYNSAYVRGGWRGFFDFHGGGILEWGRTPWTCATGPAPTTSSCPWSTSPPTPVASAPTRTA